MTRTLRLFALLPCPVWIVPDDLLTALDAAVRIGKVKWARDASGTRWAVRVTADAETEVAR